MVCCFLTRVHFAAAGEQLIVLAAAEQENIHVTSAVVPAAGGKSATVITGMLQCLTELHRYAAIVKAREKNGIRVITQIAQAVRFSAIFAEVPGKKHAVPVMAPEIGKKSGLLNIL